MSLLAASALALGTLTVPAQAQHGGHQGAHAPAPAKPAAKKPPAKKPAARKPARKKPATARRTARPAAVARKAPATQAPRAAAQAPVAAPDHANHSPAPASVVPTSPAPVQAPTPPVDHSAMGHDAPPATGAPATAVPAAPEDHSAMGHAPAAAAAPGGHGEHEGMRAALGSYPVARESSGTAWQPDTSAHSGWMARSGDWTLMGHGVANLVVDHQSGPRGDDKTFVSGMAMGMAQRAIGNGTLQFRAMFSPEPLMGKRGFPLLLASGETADGVETLIDRQHPHDFFMELSASVSQQLGPDSSLFLYGGLPGEPAFGPPAFMHREAILDSPEAPISHHWLDSTHISFGVLTAGLVIDRFKVEISRFNGREPDQHRWNIETAPLDSTAVRLSFNPTRSLALQGSWGHFEEPEQLEPGVDQKRWSASALWANEVIPGWKAAATLAWGRKSIKHHDEWKNDDAWVAEGSLKTGGWTMFGRGEITENRELVEGDEHGTAYEVGKLSIGAIRDFRVAEHVSLGLGGLFAVNFVPDALAPLYGDRNPTGAMGFVRLKID